MKLKAESNLLPLRNQMAKLIEPNSSVIEFGCGNGDLLFELSSKIKYGLGIDKSKKMIDYAIQKQSVMNLSNINYKCEEIVLCGFSQPSTLQQEALLWLD